MSRPRLLPVDLFVLYHPTLAVVMLLFATQDDPRLSGPKIPPRRLSEDHHAPKRRHRLQLR